MERRKDYRHGVRYMVSLKCRRTRRVLNNLATGDVSASGLRLYADQPHDLEAGDRLEVQLFARVLGQQGEETLVLATDAIVVRAGKKCAALHFDAPFAY